MDGLETYSDWAHGLAFTGGHTGGWDSGGWFGDAGPRQATIDFGQTQTFNKVVIWHHGELHVPASTNLQYWDGSGWDNIVAARAYAPSKPYNDSSIPDVYTFGPVTGSKVRYSFDNSGANIDGSPIIHGWIYEFEVFAVPDIAATDLAWNTAQAGVDFSYAVKDIALDGDTDAALYWATGPALKDVLDKDHPLYTATVEHAVNNYGPFYVPNSVLGTPPPNATHLVLVVDPENKIVESQEPTADSDANNVKAIQIRPDIDTTSLILHPDTPNTWDSDPNKAGGVDITYTVTGTLPTSAPLFLRWATGPSLAEAVGTPIPTGPNGTPGFVQTAPGTPPPVHVPASQLGTPPAGAKYLVVAADPPADPTNPNDQGLVEEADESNNVAYIEFSDDLILKDSVNATASGPEIDATFTPANGALTLAQAAALCNVDQFNWYQTITLPGGEQGFDAWVVSLPERYYVTRQLGSGDSAELEEDLNLVTFFSGAPYAWVDTNHDGAPELGVDDLMPISLDSPLRTPTWADPPMQFSPLLTTIIWRRHSGGAFQWQYLPDSDLATPDWQRPDGEPYYYNLDNCLIYFEKPAALASRLEFSDKPSVGKSLLRNGEKISFLTSLAGNDLETGNLKTFTGENTNFLWKSDAVNVTDINRFAVYGNQTLPLIVSGGVTDITFVDPPADTSPPSTASALSGPLGTTGWYTGPVTLTLGAMDDVSGAAATQYRLDGGLWQAYAASFTVSAEGVHTLEFYSTDNVGNVEATRTQAIKVDQTPPATTAGLSGPLDNNGWYVGPVTVALAAIDTLSGMAATQYRLDGGSWQVYAGAFVISADGVHAVDYYSTDNAGNVEVTHTQTIKLDQTRTTPPPLVTMTHVQMVPNKKHQVTQILVTFSGPLDATQAQALGTYRLTVAGKKGSFTAKNSKLISLRSAVYNDASHTVMLTPKKQFRLSKAVLLQVNGLPPSGLQDSIGRLIDGNRDGQPGGNASAVLRPGRATISAVVYQGIGTVPSFEPSAIDSILEREDLIVVKPFARTKHSRQ